MLKAHNKYCQGHCRVWHLKLCCIAGLQYGIEVRGVLVCLILIHDRLFPLLSQLKSMAVYLLYLENYLEGNTCIYSKCLASGPAARIIIRNRRGKLISINMMDGVCERYHKQAGPLTE